MTVLRKLVVNCAINLTIKQKYTCGTCGPPAQRNQVDCVALVDLCRGILTYHEQDWLVHVGWREKHRLEDACAVESGDWGQAWS